MLNVNYIVLLIYYTILVSKEHNKLFG